jgi:DNA-binding Xre family transcriptional regulator
MAVSYNKLWKLLIDKKVSPSELRKAAEIAPNTMTKLRRDEPVNLSILGRICRELHCDFGDILTYCDEKYKV